MMPLGTRKYDSRNGPAQLPGLSSVVDDQFQPILADMVRQSKAYATWRSNDGIIRRIESAEKKYGINLSLPWCSKKLMNFVCALAMDKCVASTIRTYVARVKGHHRMLNLSPPEDSVWLRQFLKGLGNNVIPNKFRRLAMTPDLMLLLKNRIAQSDWELLRMRLVWLVACFLFNGSLRPGEVLCATTNRYLEDSTLRPCDIKSHRVNIDGRVSEVLVLRLSNTKETRSVSETYIELPETRNFLCPVLAYSKWKETSGISGSSTLPLAMLGTRGFTGVQFNSCLKEVLAKDFDYVSQGVLGHSFRAGMITALAKLGVSDTILQRQGRWRSNAFTLYCKEGRSNNIREMVSLNNKVAAQATRWMGPREIVESE